MTVSVVKTYNLTKFYGDNKALNNVSLILEPGKIYGLIGENGAGKTTLMRVLTGLSYPSSGNLVLFGNSDEKGLQYARRLIGSMIEYPSLVPHMTAKENLKLHSIMRGCENSQKEAELLQMVGLSDTGKKKAKDFSLGMKQRLGIAMALISDPELLILDEPVNGLDPVGVAMIRNLLIKLCVEKNITILISSHNLSELYLTATDYLIIHKGEIKKVLSQTELDACCQKYLRIESSQHELLRKTIEEKLETKNYKLFADGSVKLYGFSEKREDVAKLLHENGVIITNLSIGGDSLEDYYLSLIGGTADA